MFTRTVSYSLGGLAHVLGHVRLGWKEFPNQDQRLHVGWRDFLALTSCSANIL